MGLKSWFKWQGEDFAANLIARILWPRTTAGTVVVQDGKILALDLDEYLTLPAGGSDKGESFAETARRETEEETGLKVEVKDRIKEEINSMGGVEVLFTAEVAGGELGGNWPEGEPKWIEIEEAKNRNWRYKRDIGQLIELARD